MSIVHSTPGRASPVILASPPDDVALAISQIQRSPLPEQPNLALATPGDRAAQKIAAGIPLFLYLLWLLFSVGLGVFGVVQVLSGRPGFLIFGLFGLVSGALSIRDWIRTKRKS